MKILLTGAEVICVNMKYDVLYKDRIISRGMLKDMAVMLALDQVELEKRLGHNNVYRLRTA